MNRIWITLMAPVMLLFASLGCAETESSDGPSTDSDADSDADSGFVADLASDFESSLDDAADAESPSLFAPESAPGLALE